MKDKNTFIAVLVSIAVVFGILYASSNQNQNQADKTKTAQDTNATTSPTTQSSGGTTPISISQ